MTPEQETPGGEAHLPEDFRDLFDEYFPRLKAYFRTWRFSGVDAEDLSQTVLLNVYKGWERYRGEGNVESWIYAAARNTAIDALRRSARTGGVEEIPDSLADDVPAPDEDAERREDLARAARALRELPSGMRACLLLQVREGLSYKEIGERLSLSSHTVKVQIWNARRRLRHLMGAA